MHCAICNQPVAMTFEGKCRDCTPSGIGKAHLLVALVIMAGLVLAGWGWVNE